MNGTRKVLVVDDEPGFRDLLIYELGARGYDVRAASGGREALEWAGRETFDLCVCDVKMSPIDGVEILTILKKLQPDIEVVMATGYATTDNAIECMRRGAYDYLNKPYSIDELCRVLGHAEERRRLLRRIDELERPGAKPGSKPAAPVRSVLVIDDDPEFGRVLQAGLEHAGFTASVAADAEEALRRLLAAPPDLALLDLMLPGMSGFELLNRIEKEPGLAAVRVIVLTARHLSPAEIGRLRARAEDVMYKGSKRFSEIMADLKARLSGQGAEEGG